jgi:hypothetical protein
MVKNGSDLFLCGDFLTPFTRITRWDGTSFHGFGTGANDVVWNVAFIGNTIFMGGKKNEKESKKIKS